MIPGILYMLSDNCHSLMYRNKNKDNLLSYIMPGEIIMFIRKDDMKVGDSLSNIYCIHYFIYKENIINVLLSDNDLHLQYNPILKQVCL